MAAGACSSPGSGAEASPQAAAIGPGWVVLIVGPSGAGKDAVLSAARSRLAEEGQFFFPRRVVTRVADGSEDHATLAREAFEDLASRGGFALHWHAHGYRYGIPAEADAAVRVGRTVVFNASRQVVAAARARYTGVAVAMLDVPVEIRAARLATRNRERAEQVLARLGRVVAGFSAADVDLTIDNSGALEAAADRLVRWLRELAANGGPGGRE